MKNIHLIPTDKPSRLWLSTRREKYLIFDKFPRTSVEYVEPQNIHITSEEEIKEGDYYITILDNEIFKADSSTIRIMNDANKSSDTTYKNTHFKIILTDNQDLIKDGVQAIDDDFLEWFVKNPSCEEIEIKPKLSYVDGKYINSLKIIIPKEEPFIEFTNTNDCTSMIYNPKEEIQSYICPKTNKQCDDECCVSAENCNIGEGVFSEPEQDNFYEQLVKYFQNTPREKVLEDWAKSTEFDNIGLTVEEFLGNKQETIEDVAEEYSRKMWGVYYDDKHPDCAIEKTQGEISVSDFIAGAKWQREIASRLIDRYVDDVMGGCNLKFKEWINR